MGLQSAQDVPSNGIQSAPADAGSAATGLQLHNVSNTAVFPHDGADSSSTDLSLSNNTISPLGIVTLECNGAEYGDDLDKRNCLEALQRLQYMWETPIKFAYRDTGVASDASLPAMFLSGDGRCRIDLGLKAGATSATVTSDKIRQAAHRIISTCIKGNTHTGGKATTIGGDNNMEVTLSSWNPGNVQCTGVGPPPKTCVIIVVTMNVSAQSLVFGLKSDPRVQEGLPHVLSNAQGGCSFIIRATAAAVTTTWFRLWEAVNALNMMCVLVGKRGRLVGIGDNGGIFISVVDNDQGIQSTSSNASVQID